MDGINEFLSEAQAVTTGHALATAIQHISRSMKTLNESRLKRDTLVLLLHTKSRVAKRDIELVLNNLERLEEIWLKPEE